MPVSLIESLGCDMNSEERVMKTLRREEVDRVPIFEWFIDEKVIQALRPGATYEQFVYDMDLDAICLSLEYKKEEIEPGLFLDEWGILKRYNVEDHPIQVKGCLQTSEDFKRYEPPDPHAPERFTTLEASLSRNKGKKAVILHLNDVLSLPRNLLGYPEFLMATASDPELIRELVAFSVEYNLTLAKEAVMRGLKIIFTGDDYAYNSGPLISPKSFRALFYPGLCQRG